MTVYYLKNGGTTLDRRLGRVRQHDPNNMRFLIRARSTLDLSLPERDYTWSVGAQRLSERQLVLDQGHEGACVGFSLATEAAARPVIVKGITNQVARHWYWRAQEADPWDGGAWPGALPFYEGTSVLAGAQVLKSMGHYLAYLWAGSEREIAMTLGYLGPVVLGINWYDSMYMPGRNGVLRLAGRVVGGHAICVIGLDTDRDAYLLQNTWGDSWGERGRAWLLRKDLERLVFQEDGEAMFPVRNKKLLKAVDATPVGQ